MEGRKKILLVSSAFYPEISPRSFRATELAKEFSRQGHSVVVITRYRDHDYNDFLREYPVSIKMWGKSRFKTVRHFKNRLLSFFSRAFARIMLSLFEYPDIEYMFRVRRILHNENGYDMMISFAVPYPVHWGTAWSRKRNHIIAGTWIADCGDPYMGDVLDTFRKPFYFGYLEKWFCRKADFITIPVESARPGYYPEFHKKIKIIPQGFDFDLKAVEKRQQINSIPEFAYAGKFLQGIRDPRQLLPLLIKSDLQFKFYIFTDQADLLSEYMGALKGKVIVSNYIKREELMKVLSKMDFLINFDNNTSLNVPSKLIDYAIINRPVLNIDKDFNEGKLISFLHGDYKDRMTLPEPDQFHIRNVSVKFLDLLKSQNS